MKCIRCGHDSKYPERPNRVCPGCHKIFAFEPRDGDPLTDPAFQHAIDRVSAGDSLRWGIEHLYYEVCRRKRGFYPSPAMVVVLIVLSVVAMILAAALHPAWLIGTLVFGMATLICALARVAPNRLVKIDQPAFDRMWKHWCAVHGRPEGVIVRHPQPSAPPPAEADLGDYSFDRAVICDRARTVDLLLANQFHFENNCAVLSVEGYPPGPFETVRAMLKRNPRLEVFVLHDATPKGCELARLLRTDPAWFGDKVKVIDVGLRPSQDGPFRGLLLPAEGPVSPSASITAPEAAWLSQYVLELAAIRPEQVLKRLFRAINRKPGDGDGDIVFFGDGGGDGGPYLDTWSFGTDAGDSDAGADSFG